jgi:hypothetical protein
MRTLTNKKGRTIQTPYSDHEALALIRKSTSEFAQSLVYKSTGRWGLSYEQWFYVHDMAMQATLPAAPRPTVEVADMSRVIAMFETAKAHAAKRTGKKARAPKIHLQVSKVQDHQNFEMYPICLSMAGDSAKVPGSINVTDGGPYGNNKWYGRILRNGTFEAGRDVPSTLVPFLKEFAANPEQIASAHGRLTNSCCFCNRSLTDEGANRSVEVGYGPICAERFGLSWGATTRTGFNPPRPTEAVVADMIQTLGIAFDETGELQNANEASEADVVEQNYLLAEAEEAALGDFNYVGSRYHY